MNRKNSVCYRNKGRRGRELCIWREILNFRFNEMGNLRRIKVDEKCGNL